jgi:rsbT co-antagonist protein RsbR
MQADGASRLDQRGLQALPDPPTQLVHDVPLNSDHYRLLVDTITDYAIIMLDADGNVVSWNAGAQAIKGYRADEIIGRHFSVFYSAEANARGFPAEELSNAAALGRFEDEGWRVRKDGSKFWANVIITTLRDRTGAVVGFGKVTRDLTERRAVEERVRQQAQAILDVSIPVVQIWAGVLAVPLIGTLDSQRTQDFMERLLGRIVETQSEVALIDITGVPVIDTQTAAHLIETFSAVRLLGARVILTGVRPAIAQTLVHLGIDLSSVTTRPSLAAGLQIALAGLPGVKVHPVNSHLPRGEAP